jgi:beta-galactosidase
MKPRKHCDRDGVSGEVGGAAFVMRSVLRSVVVLLLVSGTISATGSVLSHGYPVTPTTKWSLNQGWQFHLGDVAGAGSAQFDDASRERVPVPHTLKLTSLLLDGCQDDKTQPTFHRDVGWDRRHFQLETVGSTRAFLEFEAVHQVKDVWINGRHAGQHSVGGDTPFHFDIADLVRAGDNGVAILTDNTRREDVAPDDSFSTSR